MGPSHVLKIKKISKKRNSARKKCIFMYVRDHIRNKLKFEGPSEFKNKELETNDANYAKPQGPLV